MLLPQTLIILQKALDTRLPVLRIMLARPAPLDEEFAGRIAQWLAARSHLYHRSGTFEGLQEEGDSTIIEGRPDQRRLPLHLKLPPHSDRPKILDRLGDRLKMNRGAMAERARTGIG